MTTGIADTINWPELLAELSKPFPASAVYWRAGSTTRDKKRAQALPYAEPRVYEDRLNAVCPGLWSVTFKPWGERLICELAIGGLTRSSTGEENDGFAPGTATEAQAFKRACSKFGLGRYLYDVPISWVEYDDQKKRLVEVPELPTRFLPLPETSATAGAARNAPEKVQEARASTNRQDATAGLVRNAVGVEDADADKMAASPSTQPTLSKTRAAAMYRELEKLGLLREDQHKLASTILKHDVPHFSSLTEAEALEVWQVAKRDYAKRQPLAAAA